VKRTIAAMAAMLLLTLGCPAAMKFIQTAAQGASWLSAVVDAAEAGQASYFARHPNAESQAEVDHAIGETRAAVGVFESTISAAKEVDDGNLEQARVDALAAYERLRHLLDSMRILSGQPPDGGVETDAPEPDPLMLPTAAEAAAKTDYLHK